MSDAGQWVKDVVWRRTERRTPAGAMRPAGQRPTGSDGAPASRSDAGDELQGAVTGETAVPKPFTSRRWRVAPPLAASLAVLGILALYSQTVFSVVGIWIRSETFAHGFIVAPLCLWLVWRRRDVFAAIPARPWWPGLLLVGAAGALWLVTSVADTLGLKQFALLFMLQAAIVTVLGTRIARAALFPLLFMLFLVPFGEIFVPTLIDWTADFTVTALRWSGVPVYREVNQFIIPSGAWSVVEACSGIRYIIASVMVGAIYAAVTYRSTMRRVAFMAVAILLPIVANWLRAYMIVMIGHLSSNKLAVGVDHIIYGWIFFGLVMLLMFWVGSFWQENPASADDLDSTRRELAASWPRATPAATASLLMAALLTIVVAGIWRPIEARIEAASMSAAPALASVPGANGWQTAPGAIADWKPHYLGHDAVLSQVYAKDGHDVGLYVAYYRQQAKGHELITSANVLVTNEEWRWKQTDRRHGTITWAGQPLSAELSQLSGQTTGLDVMRLYWIAGHVTASQYVAKGLLAWAKITGRGDDSALVVAYTPTAPHGADASDSLQNFARDMSPAIERALAAARESGR